MKKFLAALAILTAVATPVFAQYDPGNNIGNINEPPAAAHGPYAQAFPGHARAAPGHRVAPRTVRRSPRNEEMRLDHAKGEI